MFLLFPLGHVAEVARRPWVTWAVMAACVATFAATNLQTTRGSMTELQIELEEHPWLYDAEAPTPDGMTSAEVNAARNDFKARAQRGLDSAMGLERKLSLVPSRGLSQLGWLTSLFVHFGLLHLLGNLFFLWIVGPLLEEAWGAARYLTFYLAFGLAAGATQYAMDPSSFASIGGASGAIAGCMGAFAVRFATTRIRFFYFFWLVFRVFTGSFGLPAWFVGLLWFGREVLTLQGGGASGIATGAHVGGFVVGSLIALGTKALGWEHRLQTASESQETFARRDAQLDAAAASLRLGSPDAARETLQALLADAPGFPGAELMLAEAEVRSRRSAARLEKLVRPRLGDLRDADVEHLLGRLWADLEHLSVTDAFAWAIAQRLEKTSNRLLRRQVLEKLANGVGKHALEARRQLDGLERRPAIELELPPAPPNDEQRPAVVLPATLTAISATEISLLVEGRERTVPFTAFRAVVAAVVPDGTRGLLLVDFVLETQAGQPQVALRVTGDDPVVPALQPQLSVAHAWASVLGAIRREMGANEAVVPWLTLPSPDALTATWR